MNPQAVDFAENITTWLQLIVLIASVITLAITVGKSMQKPNKTQDERLDALEAWRERVHERLDAGSGHFNNIDESNTVTQNALLAIMDTLINGDNKEELEKQRNELYSYLTKRKNHDS